MRFFFPYYLVRLIPFLFVWFPGRSQTGPAGVGHSVSNVLWLKADAGTSTSINGNPVSAWNDQSGNGHHAQQSSTAGQPLYYTSVMNGKPAIFFDNVGGTNIDELVVADDPDLDSTSGLTIFTVSRPQYLDGSARAIISKRSGANVNESYMMFYYTGNRFHTDVVGTGDRFSSVSAMAINNNYLIDLVYDGTQATASRSKIYVGGNLDVTGAETNSAIPDHASDLTIGSLNIGDGRPFGGYIAEVVVYRKALNTAERVIVDNYLSAKYNITLSATDYYAGDNAVNGEYDHAVAGVGTAPDGSNVMVESSVTEGLSVTQAGGFESGDYLLFGHDVGINYNTSTDVGGMTGSDNYRWKRMWYMDITNTGANLQADMTFDMSDGGIAVAPAVPANYVLLYRSGLSGSWTELDVADMISGDRITFSGVTPTNDGYYTIGTHDNAMSSLPVELLYFNAQVINGEVVATWATASENGNDYFALERSVDAITFEQVGKIDGAGFATETRNYGFNDTEPLSGTSYYRLRQTDFDGQVNYSGIVAVHFKNDEFSYTVYPNPVRGNIFYIDVNTSGEKDVSFVVNNSYGMEKYSGTFHTGHASNRSFAIDLGSGTTDGIYLVSVMVEGRVYTSKLVVNH